MAKKKTITKKTPSRAAATKPKAAKLATAKAPIDVAAFERSFKHPLKADIDTVRAIILSSRKGIEEIVKWNSFTFRYAGLDFATVNHRSSDTVQLVFHTGAKVRSLSQPLNITGPDGMIKWLAADRCMITVGAGSEIARRKKPLQTIVRNWLDQTAPN